MSRRSAIVIATLVAVIAAAWGYTKHARAENERMLASVAGEIAGRPVHVHCQSWTAQLVDVSSESGWVPYDQYGRPQPQTDLKRQVCNELHRFRSESTHPEIDCLTAIDWSTWSLDRNASDPCPTRAWSTANAINTLAHESIHMRGETNEAVTQCYAIQEDAWTTEALGGTLAEGWAVAEFMLALQPWLPGMYQSAECRRGGSLDLHPQTPDFPTERTPTLP